MTVDDILKRVLRKLDDEVGVLTSNNRWKPSEIIDEYANTVQKELCRLCRGLIVDSSTANDGQTVLLPVCSLAIVANTTTYVLSPYVKEIHRIKLALGTRPLIRKTVAWLDRYRSGWEDEAAGDPIIWVPDLDNNKITLVPPPAATDTAKLTVYRLPLITLASSTRTVSPEIPLEYHEDMISGILQLCFEKNDEETFRPQLAAKYEAQHMRNIERINRELIKRLF